MKASSVALLLLLALFLAILSQTPAEAGPRRALITGGWSPIRNLNDRHVLDIANFAVSEHNKETNCQLELRRVVKGETQVVSGTNYKLVIEAREVLFSNQEEDVVERYEVIVWEKEGEKFRKLISFKNIVEN